MPTGGSSFMAQMLPAVVIPIIPMVDRIQVAIIPVVAPTVINTRDALI